MEVGGVVGMGGRVAGRVSVLNGGGCGVRWTFEGTGAVRP